MQKKMMSLLTAVFFASGVSGAWSAELPISGESSADDLRTPQQVEALLRLDDMSVFSHVTMFTAKETSSAGIEKLSLQRSVDLALKNQISSKTAQEKIDEALGRKWQALSALLPQAGASAYQRRTSRVNLEAQGFKGQGNIEAFNTFDARISLTQSVLDLSALANARASGKDVSAAKFESEFVREKVVLLVTLDYLEALRARSDFAAAQANVSLSQTLLKRAQNQLDAGVAHSVDVARARTRLATDLLRLSRTRTEAHHAYLSLQRTTGLSYESPLELTDSLGYMEEKTPVLADAFSKAAEDRIDLRVSRERVESCRIRAGGARAQWWPKVFFTGDYGSSANEYRDKDTSTGSVMLVASMPIFESGRIFGQMKEADSIVRQAQMYDVDLKRQVEEDVQTALWSVDTGSEQVTAAGHIVGLAEHELSLATDRFSQGVADNVEVVSFGLVSDGTRQS